MASMKVKAFPLDQIKPYPNNPRDNEGAINVVMRSIQEFGFRQPLVVDKENVIIVGHTRYFAALKMGLKSVPVHVAENLTPAQARMYRIADNKSHEYARWDNEKLRKEWDDLIQQGEDVAATGFTQEEIDAVSEPLEIKGATDPDHVPEVKDNVDSVPGAVYILGRHRLMCGDAKNKNDVVKLVDGHVMDMLATDPPYGVDLAGKNEFLNRYDKGRRNNRPIVNDDLAADELHNFWLQSFVHAFEVTKPGGVYYVTGPQGGWLSMMYMQAILESGWLLKHTLIWVKDVHVLGRSDYNYKHEPIFYGWKEGAAHYYGGTAKATSTWEIPRPHASERHPTMKPVELFARFLRHGCKAHENVLEPFSGSGTTVIAAEQVQRTCFAMEIEPLYCDVTRRRWAEFAHGAGCDWKSHTPAVEGVKKPLKGKKVVKSKTKKRLKASRKRRKK